jgi:hypothetical protein
MASYSDPVLDKLIAALNATGPTKLKNSYFVGDPVIVPLSNLPMCFISRDTTSISIDTNVEDLHTMPIVLNIVYAGAKDLNQKAFTQAGAMGLYELCEGRTADYQLRADTVAGVLRANEVLDNDNKLYIDIGTSTTIDYVLSPPSRRGIFSVEAIVRTTLKQYQVRP